ncbi:hypothetical protein JX266_014476, partial [Neoarthrinium moseri]
MALDENVATHDANQPQAAIPYRLYSTLLSWDAPQPRLQDSYFNFNSPFNDPERQRLLAIAMGPGLTQAAPNSSTGSAIDFQFNADPSLMGTSDINSNPISEHRRTTSFVISHSAKTSRSNSRSGLITPKEPSEMKDKPRNSDRAAHSDIERKYRTNLKDRLVDLREAIPSLQSIPQDYDDDGSPALVSPRVSK